MNKRTSTTSHTRPTYTLFPKEIKTALRWAFRARQIPAGYERPAAEMVIYAEIMHGNGLAQLKHMLESVALAADPQQPVTPVSIIERSEEEATIKTHFQHCLLTLPAVADFCRGEAAKHGRYAIKIEQIGEGEPLIKQLLREISAVHHFCYWRSMELHAFSARDAIWEQHGTSLGTAAMLLIDPEINMPIPGPDTDVTLMTAADIERRYAEANHSGITVPAELWEPIDAVAKRILVEKKG